MPREMTDEQLAKYVPVHERVQEFWTDHEKGRIITTVQEANAERVRVRAEVYREGDEHPFSTGHAEEIRVGDINEFAATENCETSAVGRALALAGFQIERGMASRQEVAKVKRQQKAKTSTPAARVAAGLEGADGSVSALTAEEAAREEGRLTPADVESLAAQVKATGIDAAALKLKFMQLGVGFKGNVTVKAVREALGKLTPEQGMDLISWCKGEQEDTTEEGTEDVA